MLKNVSKFGIKLSKNQQKEINGGGLRPSRCCNPALSCCVPNPNYNGSNCQFVQGNPNSFPVPFCI
ncbi:hypothetical protein [uncultured Aquimarina sp.]|uniref:hypothetical protein n=1 Tax=uncultured Aquimarina sp. TaxID=575652 RepID=UPI002628F67F|nr:hypothetical protein [uncultured Aquimarina sp.]